jgi:hypothetical protein
VEGKFGNGKRKGTLGRIMAKLPHTAESVIHIGIVALNLGTRLRTLLFGSCINSKSCSVTTQALQAEPETNLSCF